MSSRVFWGFVLVLLGVLFLASNFGLMGWAVWSTVLRAWPVLLVLWGVSVLLRPLGRLGAGLTAAIALVAVAAVVGFGYLTAPGGEQGSRYGHLSAVPLSAELPVSQALESSVTAVDFSVEFGAGRLNLDGAAPAGQLATGTLAYIGPVPSVHYSSGGGRANLGLRLALHDPGPWVLSRSPEAPTWTVHLSPVPTYRMDIAVGACETNLDLSGLKVSDFRLETGASSTTITFGAPGGDATASLGFGAASVKVKIPRAVGVKVDMSTGLVGSNLAQAGFVKSGGVWVSQDYEARASHLDIEVEAGASSFNVDWID